VYGIALNDKLHLICCCVISGIVKDIVLLVLSTHSGKLIQYGYPQELKVYHDSSTTVNCISSPYQHVLFSQPDVIISLTDLNGSREK
jgi:hypothetical protein